MMATRPMGMAVAPLASLMAPAPMVSKTPEKMLLIVEGHALLVIAQLPVVAMGLVSRGKAAVVATRTTLTLPAACLEIAIRPIRACVMAPSSP